MNLSELVICETVTSTYHYHLRRSGPGLALCGRPVGWNTSIPLTAWGTKDHLPSVWCQECERLAGLKEKK